MTISSPNNPYESAVAWRQAVEASGRFIGSPSPALEWATWSAAPPSIHPPPLPRKKNKKAAFFPGRRRHHVRTNSKNICHFFLSIVRCLLFLRCRPFWGFILAPPVGWAHSSLVTRVIWTEFLPDRKLPARARIILRRSSSFFFIFMPIWILGSLTIFILLFLLANKVKSWLMKHSPLKENFFGRFSCQKSNRKTGAIKVVKAGKLCSVFLSDL